MAQGCPHYARFDRRARGQVSCYVLRVNGGERSVGAARCGRRRDALQFVAPPDRHQYAPKAFRIPLARVRERARGEGSQSWRDGVFPLWGAKVAMTG